MPAYIACDVHAKVDTVQIVHVFVYVPLHLFKSKSAPGRFVTLGEKVCPVFIDLLPWNIVIIRSHLFNLSTISQWSKGKTEVTVWCVCRLQGEAEYHVKAACVFLPFYDVYVVLLCI